MTISGADICPVRVELGGRGYDICIGRGLLGRAGEAIAELGPRAAFVVCDEIVASIHLDSLLASLSSAGIRVEKCVVPAGEGSKSFERLREVLEAFIGAGAEREDIVVALGGGVVGDLSGLVAGLMKRGCRAVQIPTTLLAQVDSSIGGKTAINSAHGKNLIGLFLQPSLVLADLDTLATLPPREIRAGLAEMAKAAMICDAEFAASLIENAAALREADPAALAPAIARACRIKARIVAADETERGQRALLNLGHTFGHALEAANGYRASLLHGEAVGCGLGLALRYSAACGLCPKSDVEIGEALLDALGLAHRIGDLGGGPYEAEALLKHMRHDKKTRGGALTLVLLDGIGRAAIREGADAASVREFIIGEIDAP